MLRLPHAYLFAASLGFVSSFAARGQAYCRSTTGRLAEGCPAACVMEGTPLYWPRAKLTYAFNERPFEGVSESDLRRIIADSFRKWTNVECEYERDGESGMASAGFSVSAKPSTTTDAVGPEGSEPNDNALTFFSAEDWLEAGYDPRAFALTSVWFIDRNERIGEIVGADMYFNGGMNFAECPERGCADRLEVADLQNVAMHEIGHFFGLAHTDADPEATMWCDARAGQVNKRDLSSDDEAGFCAAYPPRFFEGRSAEERAALGSDGCSVGPRVAGSASGFSVAALAWLGLGLWARRRAAQKRALQERTALSGQGA